MVQLSNDDIALYGLVLTGVTTLVSLFAFHKYVVRAVRHVWGIFTLPQKHQSVVESIHRVEAKIDSLVSQVHTNGGGSLVDLMHTLLLQMAIESQYRRKLLDGYGLPFWEADKSGMCVYASQALSELIGLAPEDILGNGWVTNIDPTTAEAVKAAWDRAVAEKRRFVMDYTFIHDDGSKMEVQGMSIPIVVNGNTEGYIGILTPL